MISAAPMPGTTPGPSVPASKPAVRVLIVDDEPDVRLMLRYLLEYEGYRVSEATNGHEALALLGQESIAVVITDLYMPRMSGYDLIQLMVSGTDRLPRIIAMSGVPPEIARPSAADAASLLQTYSILEKPFTRQQLSRALAACGAGQRLEPPANQ